MPARGRPVGAAPKQWQEAIRKAVCKRDKDGKKLDKLAERLVAQAFDGQGWAFAEIGNRLDGKAVQPTENEHTFTGPLVVHWGKAPE